MTNLEAAREERNALIAELAQHRATIERLERRAVEISMLSYKWMEAHDRLKAGLPYEYPAPTDVPKCIAERDRLREALRIAELAMDNAVGNVNQERAYADELEAELVAARDSVRAALAPGGTNNE